MILSKLRTSLLFLVLGGGTLFASQTDYSPPDSTCIVPLNCKEFDFYARCLVERNGLVLDTAFINAQLEQYKDVIDYKDSQMAGINIVIAEKDKTISDDKQSYKELEKKQEKTEKKVKRNKMFALVFAGISAVLGIIVLIK